MSFIKTTIGDVIGNWRVIGPPLHGRKAEWHVQCLSCNQEYYRTRYQIQHANRCRSCMGNSSSPKAKGKRYGKFQHLPVRLRNRLKMKVHNALQRCINKEHEHYHLYGARGVVVFFLWILDPDAFVLYLASLPGCDDENLVLDRIDNTGHYFPGNLRFVTKTESVANRG